MQIEQLKLSNISLSGVAETLMLALYVRSLESQCTEVDVDFLEVINLKQQLMPQTDRYR
jgi:O-methyltransferase involved in polyketide biosynthesis